MKLNRKNDMYKIMDGTEGAIVAVKLSGKLTDESNDELMDIFENAIAKTGNLRVLMYLENFKGWNPGAMLEEFKFAIKHRDKFERIAVVGDSEWLNWITKADDIFSPINEKYFNNNDEKKAWKWIKEGL